ncbi:MAG: SDR family oxidoreductase [Nitrosomonadales bacterium]|nr:SDR family oxidoreductase [Nitrosomonadales bacterium]
MRRLLIVGCGDVALRAIPLLAPHYRIYAVVRNPDYCARLRALGATPVIADLDDRRSLARIAGLAEQVLHLAPPPNTGASDTRTRNLLGALSRSKPPQRVVYISTSGVYGDCAGAWVSESHPLRATSPRSLRRVDAERQVRRWARRNGANASILRVPGIYAADRLPLSRIRQGTPAIVDSEDSYTNHIHADDLARVCVAALRKGAACRVYHSSDDSRLKMGEYFDRVADTFGLPRVPRISRSEAQRVLPEMLLSFMNESRRLTNRRMRLELKVRLRYPTVPDMLAGMRPD